MQIEYGQFKLRNIVLYCCQDTSLHLTDEQLQIFWDNFKVLDSEKKHFAKPPCNWMPPPFRDMNGDELTAYWNGFRTIMQKSAPAQDSGDCGDGSAPSIDASMKQAASSSNSTVVLKRVRGKTNPAVLTLQQLKSDDNRKQTPVKAKKTPSSPPKKRSYVPKAKICRDGKNHSVSIWSKVQLFKETLLWNFTEQYSTAVMLLYFGNHN